MRTKRIEDTYISINEGKPAIALRSMEATQSFDRAGPQFDHLGQACRLFQDEAWRRSCHEDGAVPSHVRDSAEDTFPADTHLFRLQSRLFGEFWKTRLRDLKPSQVLEKGLDSFMGGKVVWLVDY